MMNGRYSGTSVVLVHPTSRLCDSLEPEKTNDALLENNQQEKLNAKFNIIIYLNINSD
jgi:hypothetical protein